MYKYIDEKTEYGSTHLHTLDGKPLIGTSTALKVIAKPLTWWASGLAVKELGWTNPKETSPDERIIIASKRFSEIKELFDSDYLKLLDKAYRAHSAVLDKSATKGSSMHNLLEVYCKACIEQNRGIPMESGDGVVGIFAKWALKNVKRFISSEGHCYSEKLWLGGILDLLYEDKNGEIVLMDFKSSKEAYLSQFAQCAGYDLQITENGVRDKDGTLVYTLERPIGYYAVFPFGMKEPTPQFNHDIGDMKQMFQSALIIHKILNK